ncbi:hypothetical protein MMC17_002454 [Xylographa soralifera]|nr:hypothetical protein [Xylographa soralifera]
MDPLSITFGALSMADLCIKYGNELMRRYRNFANAETRVAELILRVENRWLRMEDQMTFLRSVWDTLEASVQMHQNRVLQVLQSKLQEALMTFDGIIGTERDEVSMKTILRKPGKVKRAKFAISVHDYLVKTVEDLEHWQTTFDPSWWIMTRMGDALIDKQLYREIADNSSDDLSETSTLVSLKELRESIQDSSKADSDRKSIFILETELHPMTNPIPHSQSHSGHLLEGHAKVIIDTISVDPRMNAMGMAKDVRDLARVLSKVDPLTFGLLTCHGVVKIMKGSPQASGFSFIFRLPSALSKPRSLRSTLLVPAGGTSLNQRFLLAKLLAKSVFFMHTSHFVHKNIRPETVLILEDYDLKLDKPFLVGFEKFRLDTTRTHRLGDDLWERNIYRHPQRQGVSIEEDFVMQHDIYSLGVVLLEIGMGFSFVEYHKENEKGKPTAKPSTDSRLELADVLLASNARQRAISIKKRFTALAKECLPAVMGQRYTQVVVSCLACLDKDNEGFGDQSEFEDEDGILVGVRFIEKILEQLDEIFV